jgi:hypothetical protein
VNVRELTIAERASSFSESIPGFPDEENENGDYPDHDKHPVLNLEAQKSEMLDQKMHRSAPNFCAG